MSTTTTIGEARSAVISALDTGALLGNVHYAWPGPDAEETNEMAYIDQIRDWTIEIPNIKAGRKQRQESYTLELVIWTTQNQLTASGAQTTFERALTLLGVAEDALANDVQLGDTDIQKLELAGVDDVILIPFDTGWGCQLTALISGEARLT